jgi:hypothetical protein
MAIAWSMHLLHTTGQLREESGEFVLLFALSRLSHALSSSRNSAFGAN